MEFKSQFELLVKAAKQGTSGSKEAERAFAAISKGIDEGNIPTKEELDTFFDIETVASKAKGDFAKYGKEVIRKVMQKVGNNAEVINDLNLVIHATFFQDVKSVEKLLKVPNVDANVSVKYAAGKIRGATPINLAASLIGDKDSDAVFEVLADHLVKQKKQDAPINVGDWIAWGMAGSNEIGGTYKRMQKYSEYFEISDAELMKLMAGITAGQFPQTPEIQAFVDALVKNFDLMNKDELSKYAATLNTNVALVVTNIDDNTPEYKLKFALQCVALSTEKLDLIPEGLEERGQKILKWLQAVQEYILQLPPDQQEAVRSFVVNPDRSNLDKLPETLAKNEKFINAFLGSNAEGVEIEKGEQAQKSDEKSIVRRVANFLKLGKGSKDKNNTVEDDRKLDELFKDDFVSLEELQDKSREFLGKLAEKELLASTDLENIPNRFDALEDFVKEKYQKAANTWFEKQISNFNQGDEVAKGFIEKRERVGLDVMRMNLDEVLQDQDRLVKELGTRSLELKRDRSQSALRSSDEAPTKHR